MFYMMMFTFEVKCMHITLLLFCTQVLYYLRSGMVSFVLCKSMCEYCDKGRRNDNNNDLNICNIFTLTCMFYMINKTLLKCCGVFVLYE